jgi:hypothetical protein
MWSPEAKEPPVKLAVKNPLTLSAFKIVRSPPAVIVPRVRGPVLGLVIDRDVSPVSVIPEKVAAPDEPTPLVVFKVTMPALFKFNAPTLSVWLELSAFPPLLNEIFSDSN